MNTNGIVQTNGVAKTNGITTAHSAATPNLLAKVNGVSSVNSAVPMSAIVAKSESSESAVQCCPAVKDDDESIPSFKANGMEVLIRHIIIEMNKCMFDQLNDPSFLEESLIQMTHIMNTDVKSKATYKFKPHGVTSMLIIGASHISVHTWPEHGYADIDLVVCTKNFEMEDIIAYLNERFGTDEVRYMEIQRGVFA